MSGFDPERYLDAAAPALGLDITPAQRPGVVQFLAVAAGMAEVLAGLPLPDDSLDLAPVWRPGRKP
ncbi:MAG: hypothetical protein OHK0024_28840 [Thalassobaculales bacterium]